MGYCVFCEIIARREPARIEYEDDDVIVFHNVLNWVPVMMLAVPKQHMLQYDLWSSDLFAKVSRAAADAGAKHCPQAFASSATSDPMRCKVSHMLTYISSAGHS